MDGVHVGADFHSARIMRSMIGFFTSKIVIPAYNNRSTEKLTAACRMSDTSPRYENLTQPNTCEPVLERFLLAENRNEMLHALPKNYYLVTT